jgi:hypothetical protein
MGLRSLQGLPSFHGLQKRQTRHLNSMLFAMFARH